MSAPINPSLRAAASHASPTTCGHRAPFTTALLRSQNRTPAQLAEGDKRPDSGSGNFSIQYFDRQYCHLVIALELDDIIPLPVTKNVPVINPSNNSLGKPGGNLQFTQDMNMARTQLGDGYRTKSLNMRRPLQMPSIPKVRIDCVRPPVFGCVVQRRVQKPELFNLVTSEQQEHLAKSVGLLPAAVSFMNIRKCRSANDSQYGTESLSPSSLLLNHKVIEHNKKSPTQNTNTEEGPNHPYSGNLHGLRHFELHHLLQLLAAPMQPSLPTIMPRVHGGAA